MLARTWYLCRLQSLSEIFKVGFPGSKDFKGWCGFKTSSGTAGSCIQGVTELLVARSASSMAVVLRSMELLLGRMDHLGSKGLGAVSSIWPNILPCYRRVSQGSLAFSIFHHLLCAAVM